MYSNLHFTTYAFEAASYFSTDTIDLGEGDRHFLPTKSIYLYSGDTHSFHVGQKWLSQWEG